MYGKSVTCYAHKPLFAASIPSIPQGFALSTDVVFAKVFAVLLNVALVSVALNNVVFLYSQIKHCCSIPLIISFYSHHNNYVTDLK